MAEHEVGRNEETRPARPEADAWSERRAAHEPLSTGALARWARACATHPWRVVFSWVGIVALLVVLVSTVGGQLRDQFEIPGSETQRATNLIEAEFASEQGGVLNIVFAAPVDERLDTPVRRAAITEALAQLETPQFAPSDERAGVQSIGDPSSTERTPRTAGSASPRRSSTA